MKDIIGQDVKTGSFIVYGRRNWCDSSELEIGFVVEADETRRNPFTIKTPYYRRGCSSISSTSLENSSNVLVVEREIVENTERGALFVSSLKEQGYIS